MLSGFQLDRRAAHEAVRRALAEDVGEGDMTTEALVPPDARAGALFLAREEGVLAGLPLAEMAIRELDPNAEVEALAGEGERFAAGARLARVRGLARALLTAERTALNFLQRLSGVATLSRRFVEAVEGTGALIYDTRKTTPGLRALEKYAVRAGGARNHRMRLDHEALVKDNHLELLARGAGRTLAELDLTAAVRALRERRPGVFVEIEAASAALLARALEAGPDAILLDNMGVEELGRSVAYVKERVKPPARRPILEASGGVRLETVRAIAASGVDRISVGALTHGARSIDVALEFFFEA